MPANEFYRDLAGYYDQLFPLNKTTIQFIRDFLPPAGAHLLDVGCATGQTALQLAQDGFRVSAFEPDEKMVDIVRERAGKAGTESRLKVIAAGMKDLDGLYADHSFDVVSCLGNTLVHLTSLAEIEAFIRTVARKLKPGGMFLIQIVNYTRIISQAVWELPLIDKADVSFERRYRYRPQVPMMDFLTTLTIKADNRTISYDTPLFPLEKHHLEPMAAGAGYDVPGWWGNFQKKTWLPDSPALVAALKAR